MGLPRPDGRVRWVRVSAKVIGHSVLTSLLDVTALRHAEADAATLASRLGPDGQLQRDGNGGTAARKGVLRRASIRSSSCSQAATPATKWPSASGSRPRTVRVHVRNATGKLGANTRTQAVAIAVARGEVAAP